MGFKNYARLQGYQVKQIRQMFDDDAIEPAVRLSAIHLARVARNNLRGARYNPPTRRFNKKTGSYVPMRSKWTGALMRDIKAQKGKYEKTTWIYGVLGKETSNWEDSTGGIAHFFEYGRSAPGRGKGNGGPQPKKQRAQPPRPFMRQTVALGKRLFYGNTSKEISRLTKKIRRGKIPNTLIKEFRT